MGIFLDLWIAFDTVDHNILLNELKFYRIHGVQGDFLRSYLSNRSKILLINNEKVCGVPQGSVFELILFNIYDNDIMHVSDKFEFVLSADDILYQSINYEFMKNAVKSELDS